MPAVSFGAAVADADAALRATMRDLLDQLQMMGQAGCAFRVTKDTFDTPGAIARTSILGWLGDSGIPLETIDPDIVTIYNTATWPEDAPLAGPLRGAGVTASQHLQSVFLAWNAQLGGDDVFFTRLLRASLWLMSETDFLHAVTYLIDLQRDGILISHDVLARIIHFLFDERRRVAEDSDLIAEVVGNVPVGLSAWRQVDFAAHDDSRAVLRSELDDDLWLLIDRFDLAADRVRESKSYDDWLCGQCFLYNFASAILLVFRTLGYADQLAFISAMAKVDEIRADAGASVRMIRARTGSVRSWPYAADFTSVTAVAKGMARETDDWKSEILTGRVLVPNELVELLTPDAELPTESLPVHWQQLSAKAAPIFGLLLLSDRRFTLRRKASFSREDVFDDAQTAQIFEHYGVHAAETRSLLLDLLCGVIDEPKGPVPDDTSDSPLDIIRLFNARREREDIESVGPNQVSRRRLAALREAGLTDEAIQAILEELFFNQCGIELSAHIAQIDQMPTRDLVIDVLRKAIASYPYFDGMIYELAVQLELSGRIDDSLGALRSAIAIRPEEPLRWQSLSVAFQHMGVEGPAITAAAVGRALATRTKR
jgi:hypothetical protein